MATTRFETAAQIVKDAAVSLGLPEVTDPFSSTDPAQVRLCRCLTIAGRELVQIYQWPHLRKECDITAAPADGRAYDIPADFYAYVPNTAWNQTTDERIVGPLSADEWNDYEAGGLTPVSPSFRFVQGVFAVVPPSSVTDGDSLQYEYQCKAWVMPVGETVQTEDRADTATDTVCLDPFLTGIALQRAWRVSNSMDTTAVEAAYWQAIERLKGSETVSGSVSISPRRSSLFDPRSPEGNWTI